MVIDGDTTSGTDMTFKFQSTGTDSLGSAWVGNTPVPVLAAVWLLDSGLLGLIGLARREACI